MSMSDGRHGLAQRYKAYDRERAIVAAIGYLPLLLLYLLVHTKYLRPYVPESKGAAVLVLIVLPFTWFGLVMLLHRWLGPIRHRLRCPSCAHPLTGRARKVAVETGRCEQCEATLPEDGDGSIRRE